MARVLLDVVLHGDEKLATVAEQLTRELDVTWQDTGGRSGGGWPEVEFGGSHEDLETLVRRYHDPDDTNHDHPQLVELIDAIQEV